ncbi:hypothetical protein P9209_14985 [Prescottella defluvii]|nr:hypothetical protein P9209_14985 [Prescottella defluvii]
MRAATNASTVWAVSGQAHDVVGLPVVAVLPVQSRHGRDVLLGVRWQPRLREHVGTPAVQRHVLVGHGASQGTGELGGHAVHVERARPGQLVHVSDVWAGVAQYGGQGPGHVVDRDR